jgi:hypothetical protein
MISTASAGLAALGAAPTSLAARGLIPLVYDAAVAAVVIKELH